MDNILLVEDNDFVRMQIHKFLADEGFNIIEASDGLTALGSMKGSISPLTSACLAAPRQPAT